MDTTRIYEDIARRTEGDIYIGVVGPVRTGKSTFIKNFMETLVIPNIDNHVRRERARDELPQSGSGRTIMTAEPKFVPEDSITIGVGGGAEFQVRLVDCVGYMVPGALGQVEDGMPRMVSTPWQEAPMAMADAAEFGTRKVIAEHSTIGMVVTTDGTIGDIAREDYLEAENRVIAELKELGKPFLVLVNSIYPDAPLAKSVTEELRVNHNVTVLPVNCMYMNDDEIAEIIKSVLFEFPVSEMGIFLPTWVEALDNAHPIKTTLFSTMLDAAAGLNRIRDVHPTLEKLKEFPDISGVMLDIIQMGTGMAVARIELPRELFYATLGEQSGFEINDDGDLMNLLSGLSKIKNEYAKLAPALADVEQFGYGIVMPATEELSLEQPEIVRHGSRYGVKLRASAPSIHMIRADIETEVSPIVGNERQSEDLINYLLQEFEGEPEKIWQSNIFGISLHDLVSEGLNNKLKRVPADARTKLQETLQRIINEGSNGLICIIL